MSLPLLACHNIRLSHNEAQIILVNLCNSFTIFLFKILDKTGLLFVFQDASSDCPLHYCLVEKRRLLLILFYVLEHFNPFKPDVLIYPYQWKEPISNFRGVGWYFSFSPTLYRTSCKQTVKTMIRRPILRHLIWVCTVCLCPIKRTPGLYGLKQWLHIHTVN